MTKHTPRVLLKLAQEEIDVFDRPSVMTSKKLMECIEQLENERDEIALPNEQGVNRYGLDIAYFRNVINRELNRPLVNYKPDELARVFARLSRTADKSIMFEPEFSTKHNLEQQLIAVRKCKVGSIEWIVQHEQWLEEQLRKQQEGE